MERIVSPIKFVPVWQIIRTEETSPAGVENLIKDIERAGVWTCPIAIERRHFTIMDGHHRFAAAQALNLRQLPCLAFTYAEVNVEGWNDGLPMDPTDIIRRGLRGDLYPVKSTRHKFPTLEECRIPINHLR
jgi:hypothetical protein